MSEVIEFNGFEWRYDLQHDDWVREDGGEIKSCTPAERREIGRLFKHQSDVRELERLGQIIDIFEDCSVNTQKRLLAYLNERFA